MVAAGACSLQMLYQSGINTELTPLLMTPKIGIATIEYGWSANMERITKVQSRKDPSMAGYMTSTTTMAINPKNSTRHEMRKKADADFHAPELIGNIKQLNYAVNSLPELTGENSLLTNTHILLCKVLSNG